MIKEGTTGIEIEDKENETIIKKIYYDTKEESFTTIPKLMIENQLVIEAWNILTSIENMTLFEALKILGIQVTEIGLYNLTVKLVEIKSLINKYQKNEIDKMRRK